MILEKTISETDDRALDLAPVLLVDDDVASRLTLQTLLRAGGYCVDVASSAAEAIEKLDTSQYVLVLSDLGMKSSEGLEVLAYARRKEYRPATASVTAYHGSGPLPTAREAGDEANSTPGSSRDELIYRVFQAIQAIAEEVIRRLNPIDPFRFREISV